MKHLNTISTTIIGSLVLMGSMISFMSVAHAKPVCICELHDEGWVCKPKGCWAAPNVPPLGQAIDLKTQPRVNPGLIIPKQIPGDQFNPRRIPGDQFNQKK